MRAMLDGTLDCFVSHRAPPGLRRGRSCGSLGVRFSERLEGGQDDGVDAFLARRVAAHRNVKQPRAAQLAAAVERELARRAPDFAGDPTGSSSSPVRRREQPRGHRKDGPAGPDIGVASRAGLDRAMAEDQLRFRETTDRSARADPFRELSLEIVVAG